MIDQDGWVGPGNGGRRVRHRTSTRRSERSPAGSSVRTAAGTVRGFVADDVHTFLGVPYAAPPVGPLRFAPPRPPDPWDGVRDATRFGATAPQSERSTPMLAPTIIPGDDCLHVNVHTPDPGAAGLPVLVWIHGGGMVMG